MFLRNYWYVLAQARDVGRKPLARRALGRGVVLFRTEAGAVTAMEDRCPHRLAPLSMGELVGDELQCRYHGFRYDCTGKCVAIPGEDVIPPTIRVETFPAVERHNMVWVWMGAKDNADPSSIPGWDVMEEASFVHMYFDNVFDAPMMSIVDNLLDLTHVHFTHRLLGADNMIHDSDPMKVWRETDSIYFSRKLRKGARIKPGMYIEIGGGYALPSICYTTSLPKRDDGEIIAGAPVTRVMHCLTPENEGRTRYIAMRSWNVATRPQDLAALEHQTNVTILEDKEMLEGQQRVRLDSPGVKDRLIRADAAAVQSRRLFEEAVKRETAAAG